jgi:hypothetical protein
MKTVTFAQDSELVDIYYIIISDYNPIKKTNLVKYKYNYNYKKCVLYKISNKLKYFILCCY